ncbi:type II toxin-antitoxin system VapC family toxin [Sphingomonas sp. QA11]|uniref:type II toxin-antitoxin system VapC family toxin n=1 Tax=Sphingomonas sp. QA11 TaxID=2950605 RepID=UPI00234B99E0|nr:type II toxin-antitoxin system VapC family toxin [Sphingomonas sp. QA11]WCM29101.1 type II toxin-antitoxin system VapC family toxin [Sphingomonas sp. QA11]
MSNARFLLDSNMFIYTLRDAESVVARRIGSMPAELLVTSSIVMAEVLRGIPRSESAALTSAERLFALIPPLPFDRAAAEKYVTLPFKRSRFDRLIAAQTLALGLTLVTNNERDFADIDELKVENWTI